MDENTHQELKDIFLSKNQHQNINNCTKNSTALWFIGGAAGIGSVLNLLVITLIASQGLRKSHFTKIYYFSLAVTDLMMAAASFGFTVKSILKTQHVVIVHKGTILWMGATGIAWLAISSNLFHVLAITADRFAATTFPLRYTVRMSHRKVTLGICSIWLVSAILVGSVALDHRIAFWFAGIGIPLGSFGIMLTYTRIVFIAIKRNRVLRARTNQNEGSIVADDVMNSINTILLGLSITSTYVVCNIPLCVVLVKFLIDPSIYPCQWVTPLHALITINSLLDPLWYTLFAFIQGRMKKRKAASSQIRIVDLDTLSCDCVPSTITSPKTPRPEKPEIPREAPGLLK